MKYFYALALAAALFMMACNKTPSSTNTTATTLMTGSWKLSSGTLKMKEPNGKDTSLNYLSLIVPSCHAGDYLKFYSGQFGAVYTGTPKCDASEADSISFTWQLVNNTTMNLYNTQFFYYSVAETILPYHFDTLSYSPLELDSNYYSGSPSVIDSIYNLNFTEEGAFPTLSSSPLTNISNATISNLSASSFTLSFSVTNAQTFYPDSVNHNQGTPVYTQDTFYYSLTYTNF